MENQDGKRVARGPGMPRGGKIALAVVLVLVLALAGGYVGLCAYAGSSFPAQHLHCRVDVSGQSGKSHRRPGALPGLLADSRAEFTCAGQSYAVNGDDPSVSVGRRRSGRRSDRPGRQLFHPGRAVSRRRDAWQPLLRPRDTDRHAGRGNRAVEECSDPEAQTTWEVTDTELVLHKGVTGRTIDVAALTDALAERLGHLISDDIPSATAPSRPR